MSKANNKDTTMSRPGIFEHVSHLFLVFVSLSLNSVYWDNITKLHEISTPESKTKDLRLVSNFVVHNYIFFQITVEK